MLTPFEPFSLSVDDPEDIPTENLRFLIKWKGYSHLHNTQELYEFLKRFKGFKRVENYIKQVWQNEQNMLGQAQTSREDIEALQIDKERQRELVENFKTVERIVAQRDNEPNKDVPYSHLAYLCKWKGLPYADCTWEVRSGPSF